MKRYLLVKIKNVKKFVDPVFGTISSPRFQMCRIYLDGKWKAELWDDIDNEEYHLSFKNFEGTKVTFIFPTSKDRLLAAPHIIPNNELELPHDNPIITTISDNVPQKEKSRQILKSAILGSTIVVFSWAIIKHFIKPKQ